VPTLQSQPEIPLAGSSATKANVKNHVDLFHRYRISERHDFNRGAMTICGADGDAKAKTAQ